MITLCVYTTSSQYIYSCMYIICILNVYLAYIFARITLYNTIDYAHCTGILSMDMVYK